MFPSSAPSLPTSLEPTACAEASNSAQQPTAFPCRAQAKSAKDRDGLDRATTLGFTLALKLMHQWDTAGPARFLSPS